MKVTIMNFNRVGYCLLCILVPLLWGLLVVAVSNRIETRLKSKKNRSPGDATIPPIDYHI